MPRTRALTSFFAVVLIASTAPAQPRLPIPFGRTPSREPTAAEREFSLGDGLLQQGDFTAALGHFDRARQLDPRDPRPVFYQGEVAFRQARFTDAERLFRAAIALRPTMAEAHAELGATLRELDRCTEAVPVLQRALHLQPSLGEAHTTLGQCFEDQQNITAALDEYRTAMRALPTDPSPALGLGLALASTRPAQHSPELAEAQRALREAMRRADRDPRVLTEIGTALRRLGDQHSAVMALSRARSLSATPSASLLGELAQAHAAAGQWSLAEARLNEAMALRRDDPGLYYLRALVRLGARQNALAVSDLRQTIRLAGETALARRAQEHLRRLGSR